MATKKSTRKNKRKHGRRYLKRAARRTIAALLMVTALIVAAIPATPGHAGDAPIISGNVTFYYAGVNMYFNQITNPGQTDELILTKIKPASYDTTTGIVTEKEFGDDPIPVTIPSEIEIKTNTVTPPNDNKNAPTYKCTTISNALDGKKHINTLTASTVETIEPMAFQGCTDLTEVNAGACTTVGDFAFDGCKNLTNCTLSNNVKTIGQAAFRDCGKLSNFTMPESVDILGSSAFEGAGLEGTQANPVIVPGKPNGAGTTLNGDLFKGCISLNAVKFASNITRIGAKDFYGCKNLHYLSLPDDLSSIGGDAFYGCEGLEEITIPGTVGDSIMYPTIFISANSLHFIALDNDT